VAIDERVVAKKPSNLSHLEAAGLPLVALTAWVSLVDCGRVEPGQRVLIHAGAGGVGSVAIPIAKSLGAEVITTTSTRNVELCRALGADLVIDYTQQDHTELLSDLDVVVDSLGIKERPRSLKVLRRGGRLIRLEAGIPAQVARHGPLLGTLFAVSGGAAFTIRAWLDKRVRVFHPVRPLDGARLAKITELVERGVIRPQIHQVYPLEQIAAAHADSEAGHARGKIIVDLQPQS
jgi:NADPH:quinone reductase-like Zn-dependent oxidoreductase